MNQIPPSTTRWADTSVYIPTVNSGRVIKVYDGDSITVAVYLNNETDRPYRFAVRLLGVDCPEKRSTNETERAVAAIAQSYIEKMVLGSIVNLERVSFDKYGRLLASVITCDNVDLSVWLLNQRLAVPYSGGFREVPNCWLAYYNTRVSK
jgi:endonuclease YncB( thermonuclease family)